jgi:hypothetical protein
MRQSRGLVIGVSLVILASLAVALPAAAMAPKGAQLPFTLTGTSMTFNCDGVTQYIPGMLTCASNTPFTVDHSVIAPAASRQAANQLAKDTADNFFGLSVDGVPLTPSGSSQKVTANPDGSYSVTFNDWYNFAGYPPGDSHALVFNFVGNGTAFLTETETYDFS